MFSYILLALTSSLAAFYYSKNKTLSKERDRLLSESREDSKVLFLKSRYASMGETLGNIAHQWKQPLNAIGTIQNGIKAALIFQGDISKEKLLNSVETSFKLLQHLSETIDTFYSFLAQRGDDKTRFIISEELEKVRKITEYSFENSNIVLKFELKVNPTIRGNANEFTHAILNLILNAKDAFDDASVEHPVISVQVLGREKTCVIIVCDNAGGIRVKPIDMVFDLHITTKESGSGLGLFMTKNIIENRFGGKILVKNNRQGACFTILLPYEEYSEHHNNIITVDEKLTLERINQLSHKIIELEEVEKALKKWADIFKQAHWAIAIHVGTSNTFELTNAAFQRLYGYTPLELRALSVPDLFTPESLPILEGIQKEAFEKGYITFESVHKRRDGSTFPVSVELIVIKDEAGEILYHMANIWDLSEKKAAEKELLLIDKALNNTNEAVYIMIDDRFTQVNDGACRMLGYTREEFASMRLCDIDPSFSDKVLLNNMDTVRNSDSTLRHEQQHHTKDGRILDVEIITNFFDYEGITYSYSTVRDITEQKYAREELLLKEFALNTINEAVYLIDEHSMFHYVNEGACEALGYTKEELLTMGVVHIDPNATREWWNDHWAVLREQKNMLVETSHRRKDGSVFPIEVSINYFEYNGIGYNLAVVRDITERKLLEEEKENRRIRTITENSPDIIVRFDLEGRRTYVNPKASELFNIDMMGKTLFEVTPVINKEIFSANLHHVLRTGEAVTFETSYITASGEQGWAHVQMVPEFDSSGVLTSVLSIGRDMSELKEAHEALAFKERELRALADSSPGMMGTFHMRPDGSLYMPYVSPNIMDLFGLTPEDVREDATPLMARTHPDDVQRIEESIVESARTMSAWHEEYRIIHPTKGERWMESYTKPENHPNGDIVWYGHIHDITERKHMEVLLHDANNRYVQILDNSIDVIYLIEVTPDGHFVYVDVNAAYEEVTGIPRDVVIGLDVEDIEDETFRTILTDKFNTCLNVGEKTDYTADYPFPAGLRTFHSVLLPIRDESGRIVRIVGSARDITERQEMEEELLEQNQFLDSLLNAIPIPVFYKDKETRYRGFNKAFEEFYGKKKEEMIGKGVYDLFPPEQAQVFFDADAELFRHGGTQIYEAQIRDIRGVDHAVIFHKAVYSDNAGAVIGQIGTILDITERKELESLLEKEHKFLVDAQRVAHTGSWYLDIRNNVLTWSDETYRIFEFDKEHIDDLHKAFYECVHPDDREMVNAPYLESLNTRLPYQVEHRIVMADGRIKYVIERCEHTYDHDGTPLYSIGSVQDITERKVAEEMLQSNRNLLHAILESSPDVVTFALDTHYRYIAYDSKHAYVMHTLFGKEIALGMDMFEVISDTDSAIAKQSFDRALSGENFIAEEEYGDNQYSRHYWQIYYAPIYSESGEIIGLTCFNMDITERREKEEIIKELNETLEKRVIERTAQLQKSQETFRAIVENSPDVISRYDLQMRRTYVNPLMQFLLGKPPEEIIGKTPREFSPLPDVDVFEKLFDAVVRTGTEIEYDGVYLAPWGEKRWGNQRVIPEFDEDRNVIGVMVVGRDMTQRVEAEKRLKMIEMAINSSAEAVYINDKDLSIIYVNDEACRMLGYTRNELLNMKILEIDAKYTLQEIGNIIETKIREGKVIFETRHRKKDGSVIDVEIAGSFFIHEEDTILISLVKEIS